MVYDGVSQRYRELDWYRAPAYYDLVFDSLTAAEAEFLEAVHDRHGPARSRRRVLEPACGSGRLVEAMDRRDFRVSGFDLSPPMIEYARARMAKAGAEASLWVDDMARFSPRPASARYDLAHCLVSSFKYLLGERAARAHLRRVAAMLVQGGIYVLGFHLSDYDDRRIDRERWSGKRGRLKVESQITSWPPDPATRRERIRSRLTVERGSATERFETHWDFRTYDATQVRHLLAGVPALEHVTTYDMTYDLDTEHELGEDNLDQVLILRKR